MAKVNLLERQTKRVDAIQSRLAEAIMEDAKFDVTKIPFDD